MSSTSHQTADLQWAATRARRGFAKRQRLLKHQRLLKQLTKTGSDTAQRRGNRKARVNDTKLRERRMPVISYREVIAAWALIVVVGGILFGSDLVLHDMSTACQQRVVAPQRPIPGANDIHDHGERLERLDWDKDINASGVSTSVGAANPCPL